MRRLERFLRNSCDSFVEATTGSLYFSYNYIIVRYSNHIKPNQNPINIIIPTNNTDRYVVFGPALSKVYVFNTKEAINFIKNSLLYLEISKSNQETVIDIKKDIRPSQSVQKINWANFTNAEIQALFRDHTGKEINLKVARYFRTKQMSEKGMKQLFEYKASNPTASQKTMDKWLTTGKIK